MNNVELSKYRKKLYEETGKLLCSKCNKVKDPSEFSPAIRGLINRKSYCKKCSVVYYKIRDVKLRSDPKIWANEKIRRKDSDLKIRYGISLKEYLEILKGQGDCCAICGKHKNEQKDMLSVDHNHKTEFVRGLLCSFCNSMLLRYLRDDKKLVKRVIDYLNKALVEDIKWE